MTYESWRISFQSSEQAARAAYAEAEALRAEVERLQDSVNRLGLEGGQFMSRTATAETRAEQLAAEVERLRRLVQERDTILGKRLCAGTNADGKPRCLVLAEEHARAERLEELLDQAYGYVPAGTLADQIHCALLREQEDRNG